MSEGIYLEDNACSGQATMAVDYAGEYILADTKTSERTGINLKLPKNYGEVLLADEIFATGWQVDDIAGNSLTIRFEVLPPEPGKNPKCNRDTRSELIRKTDGGVSGKINNIMGRKSLESYFLSRINPPYIPGSYICDKTGDIYEFSSANDQLILKLNGAIKAEWVPGISDCDTGMQKVSLNLVNKVPNVTMDAELTIKKEGGFNNIYGNIRKYTGSQVSTIEIRKL